MNTQSSERIRLTISVPPEVHAVFTRLANVTGSSIGREMGDFLGETVEAVEFLASKMEQARSAPGVVMREMHAYALGVSDETGTLLKQIKRLGDDDRAAGVAARAVARAAASPPSSNTGGKVPKAGAQVQGPGRRKSRP